MVPGMLVLYSRIFLKSIAHDSMLGGGTNFPQLNITVMPKKGRALLWPSTLNAEPMIKDARTSHQAMDVIGGKSPHNHLFLST